LARAHEPYASAEPYFRPAAFSEIWEIGFQTTCRGPKGLVIVAWKERSVLIFVRQDTIYSLP